MPSRPPSRYESCRDSGLLAVSAPRAGLMDRRAFARRATHMNPQAAQQAQNYLRTRVLTATPEQLQLMLFDGALRFGEQARAAMGKRDWEGTYNHIGRVQKIIAELTASLKHDVNPELCGKLASLYNYAHRKLTEACIDHAPEALDEAMKVLRYQRETWVMLLDQLGKQKAAVHAGKIDMPAPAARMEAQIRMTA